ncbi:hypothetical protein OU997_05845 [Pseudomonas sp. SL4(2022)]|uniref:hypothetical protein n=1 Tax=Pseudomonas sp. SL4(2022) TaxID=2994661 RepID=UPI00226F466D|nr:hypothetical protein [Pseudomonas sp. SL4(2022)]WAC45690.1 hypothetical protein OU997_05845 [Pseudomonas sp. SL4(2022)]
MSRRWGVLQGLLMGQQAGYLLALLLGALLPSWPFNTLFTPLALLGLWLQRLSYRWLATADREAYVGAAGLGGLSMAGLWLFYFYAGAW